jgi:hypothetical protein
MMVPDRYTQEKLVFAHRQQLQREAQREQMLGVLPKQSSHLMPHIVGKLGTFLIALGTRLRQAQIYDAASSRKESDMNKVSLTVR